VEEGGCGPAPAPEGWGVMVVAPSPGDSRFVLLVSAARGTEVLAGSPRFSCASWGVAMISMGV